MEKMLEFYHQTSLFTDLGYYGEFARQLPDDIDTLCILQRMQIIHPVVFLSNSSIRQKTDTFWGDMTKIPTTRLIFEDELLPTGISMLSELLRRDHTYSVDRKAENKIHVTCRGQAILLASILKAKGYAARVRSGFAPYIKSNGIYYDHWITEYYKEDEKRWVLVDADIHCSDHEIGFDSNDIPRHQILFGGEAYLGLRTGKLEEASILYASDPPTLGLKASIRGLFYDFHSLMNDEIPFWQVPQYIWNQNFELTEAEYKELDELATLLLAPNENFDKLMEQWNTNDKFRSMTGGSLN